MDKIAHTNQQVGLASAMAVVLLLIIFAATILQKLFFKLVFRSSDADNEEYTRKKRLRRREDGRRRRYKMAKMKTNRKHYSVGAVIWIIIKYFSLVFFSFVSTAAYCILRHHGVQDRCGISEHQCYDFT